MGTDACCRINAQRSISTEQKGTAQIQTLAEPYINEAPHKKDLLLPITMVLRCRSIGLYAVFVNLVVVLTPQLAAASSSQSYLNHQALNDILGRAAPIAGKIFRLILTSSRAFMTNVSKVSTKVVQRKSTHAIGWPSSLIARSSFI